MKIIFLIVMDVIIYILNNYYISEYLIIYLNTIFIILLTLILNKNINTRAICIFLFVYFSIPLLNISSYRGQITVFTLVYYSNVVLSILFVSVLISNLKFRKKSTISFIRNKPYFNIAIFFHLFVVYTILIITYIKYGNILINQELRQYISPTLGYMIKSSLYIPMIVFVVRDIRLNKINFFYYMIAPVLPSLLIGSRGSVIMVIIAIIILNFLFLKPSPFDITRYKKYVLSKKFMVYLAITGFLIINIFYYIRRYFSSLYSTPEELIYKYFDFQSSLLYVILPLYFSLRETVGLTNNILNNNIHNDLLNYPLFVADLLTPLPGEQPAAGQILGHIIGVVGGGGLTPGLLGGLYIDFKGFSYIFIIFIIFIISILYKYSENNDFIKLIYALTLTNFFHVYHRGFLKPEYFIGYIIILIYFLFLKKIFIIRNNI